MFTKIVVSSYGFSFSSPVMVGMPVFLPFKKGKAASNPFMESPPSIDLPLGRRPHLGSVGFHVVGKVAAVSPPVPSPITAQLIFAFNSFLQSMCFWFAHKLLSLFAHSNLHFGVVGTFTISFSHLLRYNYVGNMGFSCVLFEGDSMGHLQGIHITD